MPITIYPGSMKKRNANGSYSDLVPAIATDPEVLDDFAEEYSTSETYNIGDYCIHNSDLYKCNTNNTTGTWNSNAWDRVSVADELSDHKNTLDQIENGLAIPQNGDTCTKSGGIPIGAFVLLSGHSTLPDGYYQNTSGSIISSGSSLTSSNLTAVTLNDYLSIKRYTSQEMGISGVNSCTVIGGLAFIVVYELMRTAPVTNEVLGTIPADFIPFADCYGVISQRNGTAIIVRISRKGTPNEGKVIVVGGMEANKYYYGTLVYPLN